MLLQCLLLLANDLAQKLLFQSLLCHGKVDESRFGLKLGRKGGIGQTGDKVQAKVGIVVHHLVTDVDEHFGSLANDLLLQYRIQHGIDLIFDSDDYQTLAVAHAKLQLVLELGIR